MLCIDIQTIKLFALLDRKDLEKIVQWKIRKYMDKYIMGLTAEDIKEAISSGIVNIEGKVVSKEKLKEMLGSEELSEIVMKNLEYDRVIISGSTVKIIKGNRVIKHDWTRYLEHTKST